MPFPSYNMYFLSFAAQLLILFMALPSQSETRWAAFTTVTKTSRSFWNKTKRELSKTKSNVVLFSIHSKAG